MPCWRRCPAIDRGGSGGGRIPVGGESGFRCGRLDDQGRLGEPAHCWRGRGALPWGGCFDIIRVEAQRKRRGGGRDALAGRTRVKMLASRCSRQDARGGGGRRLGCRDRRSRGEGRVDGWGGGTERDGSGRVETHSVETPASRHKFRGVRGGGEGRGLREGLGRAVRWGWLCDGLVDRQGTREGGRIPFGREFAGEGRVLDDQGDCGKIHARDRLLLAKPRHRIRADETANATEAGRGLSESSVAFRIVPMKLLLVIACALSFVIYKSIEFASVNLLP